MARRLTPRAAFTLTELLVVISIIIALLSIGAASLSGLLSRSILRQGQEELSGALMWARQTAISRGTRCIVEIVAINDNSAARPTAPNTPYLSCNEGDGDKIRVAAMHRLRIPETGRTRYVLDNTMLREFKLPLNVVFDDERGMRRWYPPNADVACDADSDGIVDLNPSPRIFFAFEPDGSCTAAEDPAHPERPSTMVRLKDNGSGETGCVYVYPSTGVVKVK
jgi:type II secretory pathway pseudopilin PulG